MTAPTVVRDNGGTRLNRAQGSFSGTYTAETDTFNANGVVLDGAGNIIISLGFVPKYFKVINATDRITQEWFEGMNFGDFLETAANGDKTLETDNQVEVLVATTGSAPVTFNAAATVTINAGGGAMTDNDTVVWVAEG